MPPCHHRSLGREYVVSPYCGRGTLWYFVGVTVPTSKEAEMTATPATQESERIAAYRLQVRRTFQSMSDQALAFQNARISLNDCVDRQEIDREFSRRNLKGAQS